MFGHNEQHHQDENNLPEPSSNLVTPAPAQNDDSSSAYIDEGPGGSTTPAPADDTASTGAPALDDNTTLPATPPPLTPQDNGSASAPNTDQLLDIKQQALQQLTPLVGHLEQSPEEKFRTTMMMIQASDNHELVSVAYEAAQQITDEKVRAQALLDIVNEINYFTQSHADAA